MQKKDLALWYIVLTLALLVLIIFSLTLGRYVIAVDLVFDILRQNLTPNFLHHGSLACNEVEQMVVMELRLPRALGAVIAGMSLAMAGATLQGLFRNPLVDSHIIGITSGASFGGVLALLFVMPPLFVVSSAFAFGLFALLAVFFLSRASNINRVTTLVLGGLIVGTFFYALVSLVVFMSDPQTQLPSIIYWLMGSFAKVDYQHLSMLAFPSIAAMALLYKMRWQINLLSLGDVDASALGVSVERIRWVVLVLTTLMVSAQVAVSGGIGWIGLVIPHIVRLLTGPDHRTLLPISALMGGIFMLIIDDMARAFTAQELPVGLLSTLVGTPVFAYLFWSRGVGAWGGVNK